MRYIFTIVSVIDEQVSTRLVDNDLIYEEKECIEDFCYNVTEFCYEKLGIIINASDILLKKSIGDVTLEVNWVNSCEMYVKLFKKVVNRGYIFNTVDNLLHVIFHMTITQP